MLENTAKVKDEDEEEVVDGSGTTEMSAKDCERLWAETEDENELFTTEVNELMCGSGGKRGLSDVEEDDEVDEEALDGLAESALGW